MARTQVPVDSRKLLVDRVASSRPIGRSARLRTLLVYLCDQVLEHGVQEIHEQEVGHAVFGRPADYDTISDNIVRVHASMLRKRLEQYFSSEGQDEPIIIELPKGNYAPVFSERTPEPPPEKTLQVLEPVLPVFPLSPAPLAAPGKSLKLWILGALGLFLAVFGAVIIRERTTPNTSLSFAKPASHGLWAQMFLTGRTTDIVLDDEGVALYEELTGAPIALSDYFNRNYLRGLGVDRSKQGLSQEALGSIILKRQSSYASAVLMYKLGAIAAETKASIDVHFARDYSFRELQVNNAVLLGSTVSNPWIEAFQDHLGLRWRYDSSRGAYYPVDTWARNVGSENRFRTTGEGYAMVALVPNLGGNGTVLIVSTSGGAAMNAAGDFLADNESVARLKSMLPDKQRSKLPYLEALLRIKGRSRLTRDTAVLICRSPRG